MPDIASAPLSGNMTDVPIALQAVVQSEKLLSVHWSRAYVSLSAVQLSELFAEAAKHKGCYFFGLTSKSCCSVIRQTFC